MRYGPGKFEACGNLALVSQYLYDGDCLDDTIGSSDELGWFGFFEGKIKGRGPFYAVVSEDNYGFVEVEWLNSKQELEDRRKQIEDAYADFDQVEEC